VFRIRIDYMRTRIRIQNFRQMRIQIRVRIRIKFDPSFLKVNKKIASDLIFLILNIFWQSSLPKIWLHWIYCTNLNFFSSPDLIFLLFGLIFTLLDPDLMQIRIRIQARIRNTYITFHFIFFFRFLWLRKYYLQGSVLQNLWKEKTRYRYIQVIIVC
jgi:hypothetical protein